MATESLKIKNGNYFSDSVCHGSRIVNAYPVKKLRWPNIHLKEQGRHSARSRRINENAEIAALAETLPIPENKRHVLDKSSIIRLATSYLRLRHFYPEGFANAGEQSATFDERNAIQRLKTDFAESLDGFLLILCPRGKVIYASENIVSELGYSQIDITGTSIYEFILKEDQENMRNSLNVNFAPNKLNSTSYRDFEIPKSFYVRMKCSLNKKSRGITFDNYKVIHFSGYLKLRMNVPDLEYFSVFPHYENLGLVAIGCSIPSHSVTSVIIHSKSMFMFRTGLDLTMLFIESTVQDFVGYEPNELQSYSLYHYIHPCDGPGMQEAHRTVLTKGQVVTKYYRFLHKKGGWVWIQSYTHMIYRKKTFTSQCLLHINYVLSSVEAENLILNTPFQANTQVISKIGLTTEPFSCDSLRNNRENKVTEDVRSNNSLISLAENSSPLSISISNPKFKKISHGSSSQVSGFNSQLHNHYQNLNNDRTRLQPPQRVTTNLQNKSSFPYQLPVQNSSGMVIPPYQVLNKPLQVLPTTAIFNVSQYVPHYPLKLV